MRLSFGSDTSSLPSKGSKEEGKGQRKRRGRVGGRRIQREMRKKGNLK
jgi:hypothetical protein